MVYVKNLVGATTWPAAILALPSPPGPISVNLTPPNPDVLASSPTASIWFLRGVESRDQGQLKMGTLPRNTGPGTPSGTKAVDHTIAIYLAWEGTGPADPNQDTLFPAMVDAVRAVLRTSGDPELITDPWTGEESWLIDVGELIDYQTSLEALAPMRQNRWDALLTCTVAELISA